jgi:hypothetical protein
MPYSSTDSQCRQGYPQQPARPARTAKNGGYADRVSDAIHSSLADIQAALTASCSAESADGTVRAEASAKRQIALQLSPAAMKMRPDELAAMILTTQRQAQSKAEAAITARLDTFRSDPRVAVALDNLRDTQASPAPPPRPTTDPDDEDGDSDFIDSIYKRRS